jgi:predicted nucleotide-binding protein (sugar kinase/HSP70/actin superfamily)
MVAEKYVQALGIGVLTPPPTSQRTLDLGMRGTPETLCIPCRLLYGNYLEAAERGATDIVILGGPGTCRLGYAAAQQAERLRREGLAVRTHIIDLYHLNRHLLRFTRRLTGDRPLHELVEPLRFVLGLLSLTDALETITFRVRARESESWATDRVLAAALQRVASLSNRQQLEEQSEEILDSVRAVKQLPRWAVLRVGLVGDVYTILTPFLNQNLEVELGRMGVEVRRWFRYDGSFNLPLPTALRRDRGARAKQAGRRYLQRDVGGFAHSSVGEAALMAQGEVDGLIHVAPFNCTPEMVAQSALVALRREQGIPVLTLLFDEQTGRAGVLTRLEAFVDMLQAAHKRRR